MPSGVGLGWGSLGIEHQGSQLLLTTEAGTGAALKVLEGLCSVSCPCPVLGLTDSSAEYQMRIYLKTTGGAGVERDGMIRWGRGLKRNKNLSATEPKDITSLRIHSISQQSPDGHSHRDAASASLPLWPHGLLVNLGIY